MNRLSIHYICTAYFFLLVALPGVCLASTIFQQVGIASPPVPVGSGARAMGMGGAFIAVADDATAASWNPAGLIQLEKPELSIVGAYDNRRYQYSSDSHPEAETTSATDYASINYLSAALPFHFYKNMVVALNYQRLYDFQRSLNYNFDYAFAGLDLNQANHFEQSGFIGAAAIAGAVELTPRISLGVTLNLWTDQLGWNNGWTESYRSSATGTQSGVPVTIDTYIQDSYDQFRGINFNIGLLWDTPRFGRLGAVIKTPFTASAVHKFSLTQKTVYGEPVNTTLPETNTSLKEDVDIRMPLSYGLGWSKRFGDVWTLNLDVYRIEWDDYMLTDSQANEYSPIDGRPKDQSDVSATHHIRLGTEYLVLMPEKRTAVPLRAGLFYDPEPAEGNPLDFFGFSLGAGLSRSRFSLDLAYLLRWANDIDTGNQIASSKADVIQHTVLLSLIFYL